MFDGNSRIRKEVNLSGRRKQTTENKQALLRNAEAKRQQRQDDLRRAQAARFLQRWTRGCLTRLHILKDWLPVAHNSLAITSHCVYYFRRWMWKHSTTVQQVLARFATESVTSNERDDHSMDVGSNHGSKTIPGDTSWSSQKRLLQVTLQVLSPTLENTELQALVSLLQLYWPLLLNKKQPDDALFLDLAECLSRWIYGTDSSSSRQSHIIPLLCQWTIRTSLQHLNPHARGLVASIIFTSSGETISLLPGDLYTVWLVPLAQSLQTNVVTKDIIQQAAQNNLQNGNEIKILSNLLSTDSNLFLRAQQNPQAILQILTHVLRKGGDSTFVASLLIRGDVIAMATTSTCNAEDAPSPVADLAHMGDSDDEDYNDDYDEYEYEETKEEYGSDKASKKIRPISRLARKDLLTLSKLDEVYQNAIIQQKRDCKSLIKGATIRPSSASTLAMANTLVQAPWLTWGLTLLDDTDAYLFVELLGLVMQSTTSLRPMTKVGILSPLAFHKPFMLKLWKYSIHCSREESHKDLALAIFCDLFAHYLVALSDVDFLQHHINIESNASQGVMATDVISLLRTKLYALYWTRPVVVSEVSSQSHRGRLLLAGTKVWNSLYERWNRLVRTNSFCDESIWWFQHLTYNDGGGAIIPTRERREAHSSNESMDIDFEHDSEEEGNRPMSATEVETNALADAFKDPKMARILTCIPQALPFGRRVQLFHSLLKADKFKTLEAANSRRALMGMAGQGEIFFDNVVRQRVRIRRAKLYKDSMRQLNELGSKIKHTVQVSFVNQHGIDEVGIDGGGVFKEFLDDLIKDGFASSTRNIQGTQDVGAPPLFSVTPQQTLAVNFDIADDAEMLIHYEFLGRVLGKAVYESILVEPQFCLPFLNQLLGKTNSMEDLKNYDEEYYNNLNKLKLLNDAEVEAMGLTFEISVGGHISKGSPKTVDLLPGGRLIPVKSKVQIFQYMHAVANQLLNIQGARQTKAFLRGFRDLIPASWVRLFSANELQNVISGDDSVRGIDVPSLKLAMSYLGGYHSSQQYIKDFWDIIENDLSPEQQRKFLRFMTSCSRQPLLGFGSLEPSPAIQQIRLTDEEPSKNSKLPSSQTCFNLLKLPNYNCKALLKEKLLAAIESGAGFELT